MTAATDLKVDTHLIGIVHDAMRRDLGRTFDTLSTLTPINARRRTALADHLHWTLAFLRRHHASEDAILWPLVRRRSPDAKRILDELTASHARIHSAANAVERAACTYRDSDTMAARDELRGALERLCAVLLPQMGREEDEAAPIIAASVTDLEWDDWVHALLHTATLTELTLERFWLIDSLDTERRAVATHAFRLQQRVLPHRILALTARHRIRRLWSHQSWCTSLATARARRRASTEVSHH